MKIAIVDKYNKNTKYDRLFDMDFDTYHLSTSDKKKLLKKDIDIEINTDEYDYLILVGSDATKHFCSGTVTSHQGYLVDEKFIPLMDPVILNFKPNTKPAFDRAVQSIKDYISGDKKKPSIRYAIPVEDEKTALETLKTILELSPRPMSLDTETTSLYPRDGHLLGISLAVQTDVGYYISSDVITEECVEILQQIVYKHRIVFQNAKFDISWLQYHLGLDFKVHEVSNITSFEDTLLLHYALDETTGSHGLKDLALKYTDVGDYDRDLDVFKRQYCKRHKMRLGDFTYDLIPFDIMYGYASLDAMVTLELFLKFEPLVKDSRVSSAYDMLKKGIKLLIHIENNGVPFDESRLLFAQKKLSDEIFELERQIYDFDAIHEVERIKGAVFKPGSGPHLTSLFYEVLNLIPTGRMTDGGAHSMDAEALEELSAQHPVAVHIGKIKKAKKIKSTYIDKVLAGINWDGKLRTFFNLTTTTSGRLSSSGKLNMQQLPRDNKIVKWCIKAPEGYTIVSQDLATAEMYAVAVLSKDKSLMQVFIDKQNGVGADFHSTVAHMVFNLDCEPSQVKEFYPELRQAAKAISFGILYGSGPQKVADTVNESGDGSFTLEDANDAIKEYFKKFPKLKKWIKVNQDFIKDNGFIYSIFNRKRRLGNVFSKDRATVGHEVRSGINFLVQSVASDINLMAACELQEYINVNGLDVQLFGLVHDSILALVKNEHLEEYLDVAGKITQQDFGVMIPGCPIGIDQEVGEDYSFKVPENETE